MNRLLDVLFASIGLVVSMPILAVVYFVVLWDSGSPLFCQTRVGRNQKPFVLIKFRTMYLGTASVASHLADATAITAVGNFLRQSKLDELPQLWNVLRGDMSLVGPRPCLPEQKDLIYEREIRNVFLVRPGITGLAQISGIDMSTPRLLAETDAQMLASLSAGLYIKYIFKTIVGSGRGDRIPRT